MFNQDGHKAISPKPIAIIPARGGSKRIPRKNLRKIGSDPILALTIAGIQRAAIFEEIFVSTDDDEIASVSELAGAKVPFLRDAKLADDYTGTHEVIRDFISRLGEDIGLSSRLVCCVYPAAFLLEEQDFKESHSLARHHPTASVVAASKTPTPPQRLLKKLPDGRAEYFFDEFQFSRSQDLEPAYSDAGQLYWASVATWALEPHSPLQRYLFELPRSRAIDIDTEEDWAIAEAIFWHKIARGEGVISDK